MADVIKEFLVGLGYKVDGQTEKKFNDSITKATKTMESFGRTMGVAVAGIAYAINDITANLENLYYAAIKSNTTVSNLTAMRYGYSQVGISASSAAQAVQSVANAINSNPQGYEALLGGLGINLKDNGKIKDTTLLMNEMVKAFKAMGEPGTIGFSRALQYANLFGIPDLLLFERGIEEAEKYQQKMKQLESAAGVNFNQTAEQSHRIQQLIRDLGANVDVYENIIIKRFYEPTKYVLEQLNEEFAKFNNLDQPTEGWSTFASVIIGGLTGVKVVALALSRILGIGTGGIGLGWLGTIASRLSPWAAAALVLNGGELNVGESMRDLHGSDPTERDEYSRKHPYVDPSKIPRTGGEETTNAMSRFMAAGYSRAQAAGIVANLQAESNLNPAAEGDPDKQGVNQAYGIAQWHPSRQRDFEKWSGHSIRGSTIEEQYAFVLYELKTRVLHQGQKRLSDYANDPEGSAGHIVDTYELPYDRAGATAMRGAMARRLYDTSPAGGGTSREGSGAVTQNNSTNITVNTADEPHAIGKAVGDAHARVLADQVRDLKSAVGRP